MEMTFTQETTRDLERLAASHVPITVPLLYPVPNVKISTQYLLHPSFVALSWAHPQNEMSSTCYNNCVPGTQRSAFPATFHLQSSEETLAQYQLLLLDLSLGYSRWRQATCLLHTKKKLGKKPLVAIFITHPPDHIWLVIHILGVFSEAKYYSSSQTRKSLVENARDKGKCSLLKYSMVALTIIR